MWPFKSKSSVPTAEVPRSVFLFMNTGHLRIADAERTNIGWIASAWPSLSDEWMVLLPAGQVKGSRSVIGWMPRTGWPQDVVGQFTAEVIDKLGCG